MCATAGRAAARALIRAQPLLLKGDISSPQIQNGDGLFKAFATGLVSPPIRPRRDEQKQMTSQIMFCFHRADCYESLVYSLLVSLKDIMPG